MSVLAVLDGERHALDAAYPGFNFEDHDEARAAVAELIASVSKLTAIKHRLGFIVSAEDLADIAVALRRIGSSA